MTSILNATLILLMGLSVVAKAGDFTPVKSYTYGDRPFYLIDDLDDAQLKKKLQQCGRQTPRKSLFSIAHRGAPLQYPEHTKESYLAAARQGAGVLECDVAFTKDHQLVCRHAQNDLHTTTNILATPLATKCTKPFVPAVFDANGNLVSEATAECRTSDITLAEFRTLKGKMDSANTRATNVDDYMKGTPSWRTDLYAQNGTLMTHKESIELFKKLGVRMTPELKAPVVDMPHEGFSQENYAQKLIDEYRAAGVAPNQVYPQSFLEADIRYWLKTNPDYARQAVFLDEQLDTSDRISQMAQLRSLGVNYLGAAIPLLINNDNGKIRPSLYAKKAREHGFNIIAWTTERSGPLASGGGWYYTGVNDLIHRDGDTLKVIDVLAKQVGVVGIFSDWPATTTYYANCQGLP